MVIKLKKTIIADYFSSGKLPQGTKLPTIKELSSQYHVSSPTIGKVAALLEAEGWLTKRRGSGLYVADRSCHKISFFPEKEQKIGCIIPNINLLLTYKIAMGVESIARTYNYLLDIAVSNARVNKENRQIESMIYRGVKGIVVYPAPNRGYKKNEYLSEKYRDFPIVVVDLYHPFMKRDHVIFDNFSAGCEMTLYLLSKNRRKIVFVTFNHIASYPSLNDRLKGYRRALRETATIPERIVSHVLEKDCKRDRIVSLAQKLISLDPKPDAIIVPNDYYADGIISSLKDKKIAVPQEIIVCGFDNTQDEKNEFRYPTTYPDFFRMGERAAEILFDRIKLKHTGHLEVMLPCPLLVPEFFENGQAVSSLFKRDFDNNNFAFAGD